MKKRNYKLLWLLAVPLVLAAIVAFDVLGAGAIIEYYAGDNQQKDLSFSYSSCDRTNKAYKNTVTSQRWEGGSLVVTGVAFLNCSATWLFGAGVFQDSCRLFRS
jgi:hypothetical protein